MPLPSISGRPRDRRPVGSKGGRPSGSKGGEHARSHHVRPVANYGDAEQIKTLQIWSKWSPPEGYEIKSFVVSANGTGYILAETDSAEALGEAALPWANVLLNYDITPVVEIDTAVGPLQKAIEFRHAALNG